MNKSQLIKQLTKRYDHLKAKDIKQSVDSIIESMSVALENGNRIEIRGFGSYNVQYQKPRRSRNPKTGSSIQTTEKYLPRFRPAKELRERANNKLNK